MTTIETVNGENGLKHCYNKGCGKKFDVDDNKQDSCIYHPGPPYFHDAYKIWKCCGKRSTDFGTWLSFPGCTRGQHNGDKAADDAPKIVTIKEIRPENKNEVIVWNGLNKPAERPATKREMVSLQIQLTAGANQAIEEELRKRKEALGDGGNSLFAEKLIGTTCKNNTCIAIYTGPEVEEKECVYHPGVAIFHEGMKFWSCCKRKTTDFGSFMDQKGCSRGKHCWIKDEQVENVREDWFQRSGEIHISIYCKGTIREGTRVESDGINLRATLKHGFGDKETAREYDLFGEILPNESSVLISERKVELVLKQGTQEAWPRLNYQQE